jgi:hypothetical protein
MSEEREALGATVGSDQPAVRLIGMFVPWRLTAYGLTLAGLYLVVAVSFYVTRIWFFDDNGRPIYTEFTNFWSAGVEALRGQTAVLYVPAEFKRVQEAFVGHGGVIYSIWPYPPTFLLILAPFAALPYFTAFLTWDLVTLLGCIVVVYLVVRRGSAIALVLASPFTARVLLVGQDGLLTASLLGASLLSLERWPLLAGTFLGCLTYKPHLGILFPVALAAARQWRAFASAAATAVVLTIGSAVAFGAGTWVAFPAQLIEEANESVFWDQNIGLQTVHGLIRVLHGGAGVAWLAQGLTALGAAVIVWIVWRSRVRYSLKAATLSAIALLASPHTFVTDMAAIAIPVAFLASDQMSYGLLRGEQTTLIGLFVLGLAMLVERGFAPIGPMVIIALLCVILRRVLYHNARASSLQMINAQASG